ncbi:uncharacterized protein SOCE26_106290 [Sorangium cellulosum]|uniref:Uncharacterized protein n=1 Tax=Sorangium cellulosum TaxID=56 RepID=A0A2L0FBZ9_SORCE|nr:hypothetical protein [Sorangium cellulosum]AUX49084.1 uncharacterized protein SOCE26_106290 [Sorangium cellulosum]
MFRIHTKQLEAFREQEKTSFINRVVAYLLHAHPDTEVKLDENRRVPLQRLPRAVLHAMVRGGVTRAERYGITWESNLTAFVVTMFTSAPNFDEHPCIRRHLATSEVDPNLRLDLLWEETSDEVWDAVSASYDAGSWALSEAHDGR